jgi:hypothetical protein
MTEDQLLTAVVDLLGWSGWRIHHDRRSDKALQQGQPGFPDILAAKDGRLIAAELKSARGILSHHQVLWLDALQAVAEVYVWRPDDWTSGRIETIVKGAKP